MGSNAPFFGFAAVCAALAVHYAGKSARLGRPLDAALAGGFYVLAAAFFAGAIAR